MGALSGGWQRLISNAPLANLVLVLVLALGIWAYLDLPRARDPEINFNWVTIWTPYPGASAEEVAREVTEPLEDALRNVSDIRYVVSSSREGLSSILVRFERLDEQAFDKRLNDLRREVLNQANDLPAGVKTPRIWEITSSNGFPTAMLVLFGPVGGETLRAAGEQLKRRLELLPGVDRVLVFGAQDPELQVRFDPWLLAARGIAPVTLAERLRAWFQNLAAGRVLAGGEEWLVEVSGKTADPESLAHVPLVFGPDMPPIELAELGEVALGAERARQLVRFRGEPALLLSVTKTPHANTLELVKQLQEFAQTNRAALYALGLELALVDDQTRETRQAIALMESNALIGVGLVLATVALFLGWKLATWVASGMIFALAGTIALLWAADQTLNLSVLLGIVIALGMLVDDAVVIVEAIYAKLVRGLAPAQAVTSGIREVAGPVMSAVLTTVAAFLPLTLLPGVLGDFLRIVPQVVSLALTASLIEAYWLLPAHILGMRQVLSPSPIKHWRERWQRRLRNAYGRKLISALRHPWWTALGLGLLVAVALGLLVSGVVRVQFFAFDTVRLFYIHTELPVGAPLTQTIEIAERLTHVVEQYLPGNELRAAVATAGLKFTDTEPLYADHYAQVIVSLHAEGRSVEEIIAALRSALEQAALPYPVSFLTVKGGPPAQRPINVKIQSDVDAEREAAVELVRGWLAAIPGVRDIRDDRVAGRASLRLRWRPSALQAAGIDAAWATRTARLLVDGEVVGQTRRFGEALKVIVKAKPQAWQAIEAWLALPVVAADGTSLPLSHLAEVEVRESPGMIRRYQYVRTVTVEAELDRERTETLAVNAELMRRWQQVAARYPSVRLNFTGELDDIQESLTFLKRVFWLGIGLIYLILTAEFRSYLQPLIVLVSVPLALAGVVFGLVASGLPLSLYTLYGVVALSGIAVNSAIVLIAAANERQRQGMGVLHATVYAARRRLIPILITSGTTIAGLSSLAFGWTGKSLLWGPVASSIVWGLGFSTALTLWVIPLLYLATARLKSLRVFPSPAANAPDE